MHGPTGRALEFERFNRLQWPLQKERILHFVRRWNATLILDATGVGDPIYDDLLPHLPRIEPYRFTQHTKAMLIQRLIVAIEQRDIAIPSDWSVLIDELKRYEYAISAFGNVSYNAPPGFHDDAVVALALANLGRTALVPTGSFRRLATATDTAARRLSAPLRRRSAVIG